MRVDSEAGLALPLPDLVSATFLFCGLQPHWLLFCFSHSFQAHACPGLDGFPGLPPGKLIPGPELLHQSLSRASPDLQPLTCPLALLPRHVAYLVWSLVSCSPSLPALAHHWIRKSMKPEFPAQRHCFVLTCGPCWAARCPSVGEMASPLAEQHEALVVITKDNRMVCLLRKLQREMFGKRVL